MKILVLVELYTPISGVPSPSAFLVLTTLDFYKIL